MIPVSVIILAWDQQPVTNLDLEGNGGIDSLSQKGHDVGLFIKPNMTIAEVIHVFSLWIKIKSINL